MKLYEVTITLTSYVAAKSEREAEKAAERSWSDISRNDPKDFQARAVKPTEKLDDDVLDSYVCCDDNDYEGDYTARELMEMLKAQAEVAAAEAEQESRNEKLPFAGGSR